MNIGTLLRCGQATERRIAFFREAGLDCFQIAGVYEDWLAPTPEARKASDELFGLLGKYGMAVPSMFLSYATRVSSPRKRASSIHVSSPT